MVSGGLEIKERVGRIIVPVKVVPRSSKTAIDGIYQGSLKIRLTSAPVENAANRDLIAYLAKRLKIPKSAVEIVSGVKSREKKLAFTGVTKQEILDLIT